MSAGQRNGPLQREGRSITQPPLPPEQSPFGHCAAAGIPQVGLRPSFVTPAAAQCHPDCRWLVIQIVARDDPKGSYERYMALARAAASTGDATETENYYQHAEHYLRLMNEQAKSKIRKLDAQ